MSMKVVYLKDTPDHEVGWVGFISRSLGRRLCQQEVAIPWSIRNYHAGYNEMVEAKKREEEKERVKAEAKAEKDKIKEIVSAKKKPGRKKAVSVEAEERELAITL